MNSEIQESMIPTPFDPYKADVTDTEENYTEEDFVKDHEAQAKELAKTFDQFIDTLPRAMRRKFSKSSFSKDFMKKAKI